MRRGNLYLATVLLFMGFMFLYIAFLASTWIYTIPAVCAFILAGIVIWEGRNEN